MAVSEGDDLSWAGLAEGALEAPGLRRRLIYSAPSPPYIRSVGCAKGVFVSAFS